MLPIWQKEFGLGYPELGLLRGLFSGSMAGFQIPSGVMAERLGTARVLALGTALAGTGYCLAGASAGFGLLVVALFVGGLGASVQHPLGSSLMARAFAGPRSMKALGTYNFAGDIGKMMVPAATSLLLVVMPWRPALALLGGLGFAAAAALLLPVIGLALNGTSSVLYGSVPDLVRPERRARAFSVFYTGTIGAGAVAPAIYGVLGDALGVPATLVVVAATVLLTLPLSLVLKPALALRLP